FYQLRDNPVLVRFLKFVDHFHGSLLLLFGSIEYDTPILRTFVRPLPIHGCRIVSAKVYAQQIFKGDFRWLVSNLHDFGMTGHPTADFLVRWIVNCSTAVSALYLHDAFQLLE